MISVLSSWQLFIFIMSGAPKVFLLQAVILKSVIMCADIIFMLRALICHGASASTRVNSTGSSGDVDEESGIRSVRSVLQFLQSRG